MRIERREKRNMQMGRWLSVGWFFVSVLTGPDLADGPALLAGTDRGVITALSRT